MCGVGLVSVKVLCKKASDWSASGCSHFWQLLGPRPSPSTTTKTALVLQESSDEDMRIRLALFTKETGGHLEGDLGEKQKLIIDLIPLTRVGTGFDAGGQRTETDDDETLHDKHA
jgi:hypothetical protein